MTDFNQPVIETKKIVRAFLMALAIGIILFVIAVLPAEFGIDLLGAGKLFGFSRLYQSNEATLMVAEPQKSFPLLTLEKAGSKPDVKKPKEADNPPPEKQYGAREDKITITIPAGKGLEYKVLLLKFGSMKYEWTTDKGTLFFDFHGEVKEENPSNNVFYESYTVAYSNNMIGTFLSPFEGKHGWYFKNTDTADLNVSLRLKGEYRLLD